MKHFDPCSTRASDYVESIASFWEFSCYLGGGGG